MSDYSLPYTEEDAKFDNRRARAIAKIRKMPAENLTVGDIEDVITVLRKYRSDLNKHDVEVIEKILSTHRIDHHCR